MQLSKCISAILLRYYSSALSEPLLKCRGGWRGGGGGGERERLLIVLISTSDTSNLMHADA